MDLPPANGTNSHLLRTYREALARLEAEAPPAPEEHRARCQALLQRLRPADTEAARTAFVHGTPGLLAAHTHYFDGFALLLAAPHGTAVSVRPAREQTSRLLFPPDETPWTLPLDASVPPDWPLEVVLAFSVLRHCCPEQAFDMAVFSSVPPFAREMRLASLAVALTHALQPAADRSDAQLRTLADVIERCTGFPFSVAYLLAASVARPGTFVLIDAATLEHLELEAPPSDVLRWLLIDAGCTLLPPPDHHRRQRDLAHQIVEILQRRGFRELTSLRELAYRDLSRAQALLPRRLHPVLRYLVSENHRVHHMVVAIRQQDWQKLGSLLLMSHAALRYDWQASCAEADLIVEVAEAMSVEGIFGASMNGYGNGVLVAGRPFQLPVYLERLQQTFETHFGRTPEAHLI
ncbi:galactokinase [Rhodothermus marinus]|uniref:Galactokinase-like protein n=1 Tax=Rhodothermus marinus (strain ATCC 43812 / DSM 4252 / R-10) TaxID=518766 RepID=D0MFT7_RHOM4|nr:galactokinase [Rhodothermus marinus]ACY49426.1 Galactokinase-like protein [Rhodothermus marinus DSM 4252]